MTKQFLVRTSNGKTLNKLSRPAVYFDKKLSVMLKIGEYDDMIKIFEYESDVYRAEGFDDIADDLAVMDLPHDQDEIDKVFQICDYVGVLYKKINVK